jgi:hypothetical protein
MGRIKQDRRRTCGSTESGIRTRLVGREEKDEEEEAKKI